MVLRPEVIESLVAGALVFVLVASFGIWAMHRAIRRSLKAPRLIGRVAPDRHGLVYYTVRIPTQNGKRLSGWMIPADGAATVQPAPAVIVLHGWGANASAMLPLAVPLQAAGLTVLLVEARCHGRSDGDSFASLPRFAEDLDAAIEWLRKVPAVDAERISVIGHSVGAGAALLAASRRDDLQAVVSIAAFAHPAGAMRRWLARHRLLRLFSWYILRYVQRVIGHRFDDIAPVNTIGRVRCPVLLVHGQGDTTVPVEEAHQVHASRGEAAVELLIVEGSHEAFDDPGSEMARIAAFLARANALPATPASVPDPQPVAVRVEEASDSRAAA